MVVVNGFIGSNDRSVMLHHHFPQFISPFHDGFVSGRDIAQFVRANPATKVITSHQAAPPAPTTSEPPFNALELQETIVALDAVDIVGRVEHYHE